MLYKIILFFSQWIILIFGIVFCIYPPKWIKKICYKKIEVKNMKENVKR